MAGPRRRMLRVMLSSFHNLGQHSWSVGDQAFHECESVHGVAVRDYSARQQRSHLFVDPLGSTLHTLYNRSHFRGPESRVQMSHRTTFALLVLLIALYESQEQIAFPTFIRLLENAICQQHYEDQNDFSGPVDESMCKVGAIQHRLAYLRGSYSFWNTLPGGSCYRALPLIDRRIDDR